MGQVPRVSAGLPCLGLVVFHRRMGVDVRRAHNDLAGSSVAIITSFVRVLLVFIAVATWEAFAEARNIVEEEAGHIIADRRVFPKSHSKRPGARVPSTKRLSLVRLSKDKTHADEVLDRSVGKGCCDRRACNYVQPGVKHK